MNRWSQGCILSFVVALPLFAQQQPSSSPRPVLPPLAAGAPESTRHLTLDVVVTNKAGKPVSGLQQHDFILLDNGKAATITSFRAVDASSAPESPTTLLLLIDEVNSPFQSVALERDAVRNFIERNAGHLPHPVTLIFLSDQDTEVFENLSGNGNDLAAAFDQHATKLRTIRRSQGFYGAADRFQISLTNLSAITAREQRKPGRKLLIWISPGWPYLSGPNIVLSDREQKSLFGSLVALQAALRRARITVSSVDPFGANASVLRTNYYESFLKGVAKPGNIEAANLSLQVIATQSGGRVLSGSNDTTGAIAAAASDADAFYTLTIDTPAAEHPDEYHRLQIKVEQPDLTARTRTGYYAQP